MRPNVWPSLQERKSEMATITEPINLGDLLKYEAPNLYSRERITEIGRAHV